MLIHPVHILLVVVNIAKFVYFLELFFHRFSTEQ